MYHIAWGTNLHRFWLALLTPAFCCHGRRNQPGKPSTTQYGILVVVLIAFSLGMGYVAGIQPTGQWRFFSWHPLLMTVGMVGLSGIGAVTKKLGGYTNTKVRTEFDWIG